MERKQNDGGITANLINDILENICLLNNIEEPEQLGNNPSQDQQTKYNQELKEYEHKIDILTLYIKAICQQILIKTNRRMFIPELKYVVIDLVNDKYNNSNDLSSDSLQSIQSMSEAGRSVNFGVSNALTNKINLIVQKQLKDNDQMINQYKLLYKS